MLTHVINYSSHKELRYSGTEKKTKISIWDTLEGGYEKRSSEFGRLTVKILVGYKDIIMHIKKSIKEKCT